MAGSSRFLFVLLAFVLTACSGSSTEPASSGSDQSVAATGPSEEDLIALLPEGKTADCLGSLEFVSERRVEGRSRCSGPFSGSADGSLATGTRCVYSTKVEAKTATEITAAGHFVCSEGSHGQVRFKEQRGKAVGIATATTTDGRVVSISYQ